MKVLSFEERFDKPTVVCLGRFDGLHAGHRKLIDAAKKTDLPVSLFTIRPNDRPRDIMTFDELVSAAESAGVDQVIYARGDKSFFNTEAKDFSGALSERFCARAFVCGEDFTYGRKKNGDANTLAAFSKERGLLCVVVPTAFTDGKKISSTLIKDLLKSGDVKRAGELMCGAFIVGGRVVSGRGDGARLGFKTANVVYPCDKAEIKFGVYATETTLNGATYKSVTFYGVSPTFGTRTPTLETHVIGFTGDAYGDVITIKFIDFIRENKQFYDVRNLVEQIRKDIKYYD